MAVRLTAALMTVCVGILPPELLVGDESAEERTSDQIVEAAREAVVVVTSSEGLGTGFVVREDGVIATNFHVIGQGRPFEIHLAGGKSLTPTALVAYDRRKDLALIQVDARELHALELRDSDTIRVGEPVIALGHPLGLRHSVARGVVAERREFHGQSMIQVAMPIEQGNSGGPLLDEKGRVIGVVAIKSAASLGFAVPANEIKRLLENPHPITMARWTSVGALSARDWRPLMGGEWRRRPAMLTARGQGTGFGGRMLCLSERAPPEGKFEVAVEVRLRDESGAAGLAFHADGGDRHYGFYPTGGQLRLTRFDGPSQFSWKIFETVPSEHYRLGDWNEIHVKVDGPRLSCYVNGRRVIDLEDDGLKAGKVGLVKFRAPGADFRRFRMGRDLSVTVSAEAREKVLELVGQLAPRSAPDDATIRSLADLGAHSVKVLEEQAATLEKEATRLRHIVDLVHRRTIEKQMLALFEAPDEEVEILEAALLLSKLDNAELDTKSYVAFLDRMVADLEESLDASGSEREKLDALIRYLFKDLQFDGSRLEYYERSNSYIDAVLEDRDGIPITLSVLFIAMAERIGLRVEGVGIPFHFVVRFVPSEGESQLIDVFDGGRFINLEDVKLLSGDAFEEEHLKAVTRRSIIVRMLRNLRGVAAGESDYFSILRYLDMIVALEPSSVPDRWERAVLRYRLAQPEGAAEDLRWLLEHPTPGMDTRPIEELLRGLPR